MEQKNISFHGEKLVILYLSIYKKIITTYYLYCTTFFDKTFSYFKNDRDIQGDEDEITQKIFIAKRRFQSSNTLLTRGWKKFLNAWIYSIFFDEEQYLHSLAYYLTWKHFSKKWIQNCKSRVLHAFCKIKLVKLQQLKYRQFFVKHLMFKRKLAIS